MAITSTANTALLCSLSIYASYTISHNTAIERKKVKSLNHVRLFATLWTVAYQAPPSMEFSWQEYWSWEVGCHFLLQGIYLTQGSNPGLLLCKKILYCLNHRGLLLSTNRVATAWNVPGFSPESLLSWEIPQAWEKWLGWLGIPNTHTHTHIPHFYATPDLFKDFDGLIEKLSPSPFWTC